MKFIMITYLMFTPAGLLSSLGLTYFHKKHNALMSDTSPTQTNILISFMLIWWISGAIVLFIFLSKLIVKVGSL